jgi:hypothetical protein
MIHYCPNKIRIGRRCSLIIRDVKGVHEQRIFEKGEDRGDSKDARIKGIKVPIKPRRKICWALGVIVGMNKI